MYKNRFYHSGRRGMTREDYDLEAIQCEEFEKFVHELISTPYGESVSKRMKVFCYCLYYRAITPEQLTLSGLSASGKVHSERVYLGLQCDKKHGYMTSVGSAETGTESIAYFLTAKGLNLVVDFLIKNYVEKTQKLSLECITMLQARYRKFEKLTNYGHFLGVRDLCVFLLSEGKTTDYRCMMETVINKAGDIIPRDVVANDAFRAQGTFQCDLVLHYPLNNNEHYFYTEQDMYTQMRGVLKSKILNYLSCFQAKEDPTHTLLFTLHVPSQRPKENTSVNQKNLRSYAPILSMVAYTLSQTVEELPSVWQAIYLKDVSAIFFDFIHHIPAQYTRVAKNCYKWMEELLTEDPYITSGDAYYYVMNGHKEYKDEIQKGVRNYKRESYVKRRNTIRRAAMSIPEMSTCAMHGFSIYTAPNDDLNSALPFLNPELFGDMSTRLQKVLLSHHIIEPGDISIYQACENIGNIRFRNHYRYNNHLNIYVENVSDDVGGILRLINYLTTCDHTEKGLLICLVDDETINMIRDNAMTSRYFDMLYSQTAYDIPVKVLYLFYSELLTGHGEALFEISAEGYRIAPELDKWIY